MKIKITESELKQIVNESVKRILMEDNSTYGSRSINTDVYDDSDEEPETTKRQKWDLSPYDKENIANRNIINDIDQQREYTYQEVQAAKELAISMRDNIVNFYNILKKYQNKGMLRKFFSTRPKFEDYGINKVNLYRLKNAFHKYRDAIYSVDVNIGLALNYFERLRLI
jgi:hypothetical protein